VDERVFNPQRVDEDGFVSLFNGKNLDGWVPVNVAPSTFTVVDGMLHCDGRPTGELRTERMYQNFVLEVEWRHMVPGGNAGIFVWADDITSRGVPFHRSVEVQVLDHAYGNTRSHTTHGDIFPIHGARMTPINGRGGSRAFPTEERSNPSPQWNHYRITCDDGAIALEVNGAQVTRGHSASPSKGYICIESEGGVVDYRNLRIRELPHTPVDEQDVAVRDRGWQTLYTGVDLCGFEASPEAAAAWQVRDWILASPGEGEEADRTLVTEESFGDHGFLLDFRSSQPDGEPTHLWLRGVEAGSVSLAPAGKGWKRLEGELIGDRLTLRLDGEVLLADQALVGLPPSGPLVIRPGGPVELANLFVREL
jgi:hypothetical protein